MNARARTARAIGAERAGDTLRLGRRRRRSRVRRGAGSTRHRHWPTTDTTFGRSARHGGGDRGRHRRPARRALAVGAALVGSVLRFNAMQLMGAVGVGIAAGAGTGIVTGLVGTAII